MARGGITDSSMVDMNPDTVELVRFMQAQKKLTRGTADRHDVGTHCICRYKSLELRLIYCGRIKLGGTKCARVEVGVTGG